MFDRLFRIARNAQQLSPNAAFVRIVGQKEVQEYILYLNRFEQLFNNSTDVYGKLLGRYAHSYGTFIYQGVPKEKIQGEPYFLYKTGHFYDSFEVKVNSDGFSIVADEFTEDGTDIILVFGNVIGLTNESKTDLAIFIKPSLVEYAKRHLLG